MRERKDLRAYQNAAVDFIKKVKKCALFLDPGLGKSVITTTAFTDLISDLECGRVLVVAPQGVARKTWPDELKAWAHTARKSYVVISGSPAKRRRLLRRAASFHFISIDLLPWLLNEIGGSAPDPKDKLEDAEGNTIFDEFGEPKKRKPYLAPKNVPYDAIVIDESSKIKNQATTRFKVMRLLAPRVTYCLILTGTPAANSMQDLWSQIYLLDRGARLLPTITAFRDRWCKPNFTGNGYTVKDYAMPIIEERIHDITFTLREEDYANLPSRMYNSIQCEFDVETQRKYTRLEKQLILELADRNMIARDGAAVTTKLMQLANGIVYDENKEEHVFHAIKMEALDNLINELNGQTLLIAYNFKTDLARILKKYKGSKLFNGQPEVLEAWNAGQIPILVGHPKSIAHGHNLQHGGHNIFWMGPTYSLEDYIQFNKRLHRSGQKHPVMIHHAIMKGTIDEDIMASLDGKNDTQEALLNALKKRIQLYKG